MGLQGDAIRCPELAAGEGQNRPQLRIMLGNCPQVNEKKGQVEGQFHGITRNPLTTKDAQCREGLFSAFP
jgi:hypothetical protein